MRTFVGALIGFCFLVACQGPDLHSFFVDTGQDKQPIALNVGAVQVVSQVSSFDRLPHIENQLPVSPEQALTDWAKNRFYAYNTSSPIKARILIEEAYMTQEDRKNEAWYVFDNVSYRLTYKIVLSFMKGSDTLYSQSVIGFEMEEIPMKSSLTKKEQTFEKMMNKMIQKVDRKLTDDIPNQFK